MDEGENTLKAGDVCLDCQYLGIEKYLRYFKINLNGDTLLKCESNECMYPYEMSSTDDEDDDEEKNISETNSIKLIDDLLEQFKNEATEQNCDYEEPITSINDNVNHIEYIKVKSNDAHAEFEISFIDAIDEIAKESITKTETLDHLDNKNNVGLIEHKLPFLTTSDDFIMEPFVIEPIHNSSLDNKNQSLSLPILFETAPPQLDKQKINIQSIETIKLSPCRYSEFNDVSTNIQVKTASTKSTKTENVMDKQKNSTHITFKGTPRTNTKLENSTQSKSINASAVDIPKANIMSGSDFLKKLAKIEEKTPKYKYKCKDGRRKLSIKKETIKNDSSSKSYDSYLSVDQNSKDNVKHSDNKKVEVEKKFSLEEVAELLNSKKIKNSL